MNLAARVSLIAVFASFLGCASQIHQAQTPQSPIEQEAQEQPKKPATPTFTYRPGW
jgi:hypothetical protein